MPNSSSPATTPQAQPTPVLDRLQALGDRALLVRGNADRELAALAHGDKAAVRKAYPVDAWAAAQLSYEHVELLADLPHPVTVDIDGFGPVVFCHGTPRDDEEEVVLVDTRLQRWAEVFSDLPQQVRTVVCGHTHMPFVRLVDRRLVVNPGSTGMPYGRAGGAWALLRDGDVTLCRTTIDVDAAIEDLNAHSTYPRPARLGAGLPHGQRQRRRGIERLCAPRRPHHALKHPPAVIRHRWAILTGRLPTMGGGSCHVHWWGLGLAFKSA